MKELQAKHEEEQNQQTKSESWQEQEGETSSGGYLLTECSQNKAVPK